MLSRTDRAVWLILCFAGWFSAVASLAYALESREHWPLLFAELMLLVAGLSHLMATRSKS